jgi:hypothetical protein
MGTLYLAQDPRLDRPAAIKILAEHGEDHRERFVREARTVVRPCHVNIVSIFEVDEFDGGTGPGSRALVDSQFRPNRDGQLLRPGRPPSLQALGRLRSRMRVHSPRISGHCDSARIGTHDPPAISSAPCATRM